MVAFSIQNANLFHGYYIKSSYSLSTPPHRCRHNASAYCVLPIIARPASHITLGRPRSKNPAPADNLLPALLLQDSILSACLGVALRRRQASLSLNSCRQFNSPSLFGCVAQQRSFSFVRGGILIKKNFCFFPVRGKSIHHAFE